MRFTKRHERDKWGPVSFGVAEILLLLENAVMVELVVHFRHQLFLIGVNCPYDRKRRMFGNQRFYIDDQEFTSFEAFKTCAVLGGELFAGIRERIVVIDTQEGNPKSYYDIIKKMQKESGKTR